MPKIRGFHPDLWTDEDFVELSPFARLLWLGMWSYACDNGHLRDRSKQIKMRVLPTDDVNAADLLRELEDNGRIRRSNGWITVPNFRKKQRPDKRYFVICEAPGCAKPADSERESRSGPTGATPGTHEPPSGPLVDGDGDGDGEVMVRETPHAKALGGTDRFDEFWDAYDKKDGRKRCEVAYRAALKKPGVTEALLISAATAYVAWSRAQGKHPQYTKNPLTWLNGEHWRDERVTAAPAQTNVQKHMALVRELAEQDPPNPYRQIGPA